MLCLESNDSYKNSDSFMELYAKLSIDPDFTHFPGINHSSYFTPKYRSINIIQESENTANQTDSVPLEVKNYS